MKSTFSIAILTAALVLRVSGADTQNTLTADETKAGWKLLFDGKTLDGWHNFKKEGVKPGWQVKDGNLVCVDPHNAGDIVTTEKFGAFELQLDFKMAEGANSGIIYHVTDEGGAVWATGPEIQLEDNAKAADPQRCGWLYGLYQPPIDEKTGKTLDATKPAGEWNHLRVVISPDGSFRFNGLRPGKLKIVDSAQRLPRGFSILRVERDGIAQRDGIDIAGDTNISNVRVVMAYGNGIVHGNVTVKSDAVPSGTPLFVPTLWPFSS